MIEADIRPFTILLFFLNTGASIAMQLLLREWPDILALVWSNVFCKQDLWPLFQSLLPLSLNFGGMFKRSLWQAYVSEKIADKILHVINVEDDYVWLHDSLRIMSFFGDLLTWKDNKALSFY